MKKHIRHKKKKSKIGSNNNDNSNGKTKLNTSMQMQNGGSGLPDAVVNNLQLPEPIQEDIYKYTFPNFPFLTTNKDLLLSIPEYKNKAMIIYNILDEMKRINIEKTSQAKKENDLKGLNKLLADCMLSLFMKIICATSKTHGKYCQDLDKITEIELDNLRVTLASPISWIVGFLKIHTQCLEEIDKINSIIVRKLDIRRSKKT